MKVNMTVYNIINNVVCVLLLIMCAVCFIIVSTIIIMDLESVNKLLQYSIISEI